MANTYRISEKELLTLGFSPVAARAIRYLFASVGGGETADLNLVELNEVVQSIAYTPVGTTLINAVAQKVAELQTEQHTPSTARIIALERKIRDLEEVNSNPSSRIRILENRISDLERRFAGGC